jgi:hypothetical protein
LHRPKAPLDPKADWITPEEQLNRLYLPIAKEVSRLSALIPDVAKLVAQYAADEPVSSWYTAHYRLKSLPKKIPPLPRDIHDILDSKCPIYGDQVKADGTPYKIKDTHFLSLIPEEFGTINRLERDVLKPYGEKEYSEGENPLQIRYFWNVAREEHADASYPETEWVLMTNTVLPESRNKTWGKQVALVDALSQKALVKYEIPTLKQSFAAITTDMVATGERRYQSGNDQNGNVSTYTRVKERTQAYHLAVGGFAPSGVNVSDHYDDDLQSIGVAALRKF